MDFRVLGEVAVVVDGEMRRLRPKEQAVLAVLLGRMNQPVPSEVLIDRVWGEAPPKTAATSLRVHVERLRRALHHGPVSRLVTTSGGYRLVVEPTELDAVRFELRLRRGVELGVGEPLAAISHLRAALAEWRGTPYSGIDEIESVEAQRAGLERMRATLLVALSRAELTRGGHAALLPELTAWTSEQPTNEPLAIDLALAIYRTGDQISALACVREFRDRLVDDFGLDPSPAVGRLEQQILGRSPELDLGPLTTPEPLGAGVDPPAAFVGREAELRRILDIASEEVGGPRTISIIGPPGIGKSALAAELVRRRSESLLLPASQALTLLESRLAVSAPTEEAHETEVRIGGLPAAEARGTRIARALRESTVRLIALDDVGLLLTDDAVAVRTVVSLTASLITWVTTSRGIATDQHPLSVDPAQLAAMVVVELGPLPSAESGELLEQLGYREQAGAASRAADGNPFLLQAIARHLSVGGGPDSVPVTVAEHVRQSLGRLTESARLLVELAAVDLMTVIDLATLGSALGLTRLEAVSAAEAALAEGVFLDDEALTFRHRILRDAVVATLSGPRRQQAHAVLARELLGRPASSVEAARVAFHLRETTDAALAIDAARWTAREAESLLAQAAPLSALSCFDEAARRGRAAGVPLEEVLGWELRAAAAAAWSGRLLESQRRAAGIAAAARACGSADLFAQAAVIAAGPWLPTGAEQMQAEALTVEAVEWLPRRRDHRRVQVVEACVRSVIGSGGSLVERLMGDLADELAAVAEQPDDPTLAFHAVVGLRYLSWRAGWSCGRRAELVEANARRAARTGNPALHLEALRMRCTDWLEAAQPERFTHSLDDYRAASEQADAPLHRWWSAQLSAAHATLRNENAEADEWLSRSADLAEHVDADLVSLASLERGFSELFRTGRFDVLDRLLGSGEGTSDFERLVGFARLATDAGLRRVIEPSVFTRAVSGLRPGPFAACEAALAVMALPAVGRVDPGAVDSLIHVLQPVTGGMCLVGSAATLGPADAYLARLYDHRDEPHRAAGHREAAVVVAQTFAPAWQHLTAT